MDPLVAELNREGPDYDVCLTAYRTFVSPVTAEEEHLVSRMNSAEAEHYHRAVAEIARLLCGSHWNLKEADRELDTAEAEMRRFMEAMRMKYT